jgi:putative multiple sugar transport system permease protein
MSELSARRQTIQAGAFFRRFTMLIALIAVILFFGIRSDGKLFTPMNVANIIDQNGYVIVLALGMLLCILTGGNIDLSAGSVVGFVAAIAGKLIVSNKMNIYLAAVICLGIGIAIGMWHGFWIAYVRIPPFIMTLTGMLIFRGWTNLILTGATIAPFPAEFRQYTTGKLPDFIGTVPIKIPEILGWQVNIDLAINGLSLIAGWVVAAVYIAVTLHGYFSKRRKGYDTERVLWLVLRIVLISVILVGLFTLMGVYVGSGLAGVPTVLVVLGALLLIYSFFTSSTVMGRHLYAIGGNQKAARLSGVKTNFMMFFAYTTMAFWAAVAGLMHAARANAAAPNAGDGYEMDAIASCFIGGASAYGGIGTVGGTLIGALLMGVLNNGMSITSIPSTTQMVVKGLVLLAAVAFDVITKKQTSLGVFANPFRRKQKQSIAIER